MKTLLLRSLLVSTILVSPAIMAQAQLIRTFTTDGQSTSFSEPELNAMPIDTPIARLSLQNRGDQDSESIVGKIWVSIDAVFSDFDLPVEGDPIIIAQCPDPSNITTCFTTGRTIARSIAKLPLPGVTLPPEERVQGDSNTTSSWMGETLFFESCYSINGGPFDQECVRKDVIVGPQRPLGIASDGTSADGITFEWNFAEHENGSSLADSFRILKTRTDSVGGTENLDFVLADNPSAIIGVGADRKYQIFDDNVEPGVGYRYQVKNCTSVSGSEVCTEYDFFRTRETGNRFAAFDASAGTRTDGVFIEWREYSTFNLGYRLRRCDAQTGADCIDIDTRLNALSFLDTSVQPGESYVYEIFSCENYSSLDPTRCTTEAPMGASNVAFLAIDPDQFENDSNASQAATITANTPLGLERSFDQQGDVDWLQFTLTDASDISVNVSNGVGSTIGIELFDASLNPIEPLSSNLLETLLASGDYFIRLTDLTPNTGVYVPAPYVASLSAVTIPLAALPDRYEDDNISTGAKLINDGETQSRTFHLQGDTDWVRFTVSQGSDVQIDATDALNVNIGIQLYDASLNLLDSSPNTGLDNRLDPGSYFVRLVEPTPVSVTFAPTAYNLSLLVTMIPPVVLPDQYEDDNVAARAKQIIANAPAQDHTFHVDGDIDWLRFSLSEASNISIDTFNTANADIRIELYDASVNLVENPANSRLQAMELDSGDYLIRLTDARGGAFQALAYSIALSASQVVTDEIQPDKYENDDTPTRAQRVNRPTTQVRNFHLADNNDWIRIVLDTPQSITIATRGTNLADTQIFLYDSELKRIDYSANTPGVATSHARLVTDTLAAGEYFALINQIDGRDEGFAFLAIERYVLTVDMQPSDRKVDISAIVELLLDD